MPSIVAYGLLALIIAAFVIIILYFSHVEESNDNPGEDSKKATESGNLEQAQKELENVKTQIQNNETNRQRTYEQFMATQQENEKKRTGEYNAKLDELRKVEAMLKQKQSELEEKEKRLTKDIEDSQNKEKSQSDTKEESPKKHKSSKKSKDVIDDDFDL